VSPYTTPVQVWLQLCEGRRPGFCAERGYALPEAPDNAAIRWGLAFEDSVAKIATEHFGMKIGDREMSFGDEEFTCHVDGLFTDGALYEAKTTSLPAFHMGTGWGDPGTDLIPPQYQAQAQWNMMLSGAKECRLCVLVFPKTPQEWEDDGKAPDTVAADLWASVLADMGFFYTYFIAASETVQQQLLHKARHFWDSYVVTETPPPAAEDDFRLLFPAPRGTIALSRQVASWVRRIAKKTERESLLKKENEALRGRLMPWLMKQEPSDCAKEDNLILKIAGEKLVTYSARGGLRTVKGGN
jgi:hypothetical protein